MTIGQRRRHRVQSQTKAPFCMVRVAYKTCSPFVWFCTRSSTHRAPGCGRPLAYARRFCRSWWVSPAGARSARPSAALRPLRRTTRGAAGEGCVTPPPARPSRGGCAGTYRRLAFCLCPCYNLVRAARESPPKLTLRLAHLRSSPMLTKYSVLYNNRASLRSALLVQNRLFCIIWEGAKLRFAVRPASAFTS